MKELLENVISRIQLKEKKFTTLAATSDDLEKWLQTSILLMVILKLYCYLILQDLSKKTHQRKSKHSWISLQIWTFSNEY